MHPILWALIGQAQATTMVPLRLEQLVDAADEVVRGVVTEVWTERDPETKMIWTHAQVEVNDVFKGHEETSVVILEQPGGEWGNHVAAVEGVARFSVGEEGYFFVEHLAERSVTVGMYQGKYNLVMDPYSQSHLAVRFPVHPARAYDHRFIPLPSPERRLQATSFEAQIEARVVEGWDKKPILGTSLERLEKINNIQRPTPSGGKEQ